MAYYGLASRVTGRTASRPSSPARESNKSAARGAAKSSVECRLRGSARRFATTEVTTPSVASGRLYQCPAVGVWVDTALRTFPGFAPALGSRLRLHRLPAYRRHRGQSHVRPALLPVQGRQVLRQGADVVRQRLHRRPRLAAVERELLASLLRLVPEQVLLRGRESIEGVLKLFLHSPVGLRLAVRSLQLIDVVQVVLVPDAPHLLRNRQADKRRQEPLRDHARHARAVHRLQELGHLPECPPALRHVALARTTGVRVPGLEQLQVSLGTVELLVRFEQLRR